MASADYCHWDGQRCLYEAEHEHCGFHTAFLEGDPDAMFVGLNAGADFPAGVTLESAEKAPDGTWRLVVIATPDRSQ